MADHAVLIGIESYPGMKDLAGPCNDAQAIEEWLIDPVGGGLNPANVAKKLTSDFPPPSDVDDAHPMLSDLDILFRPLVEKAALKKHTKGRLFIFVAGHGFADAQDMSTAALFTANARFLFPLHLAIIDYVNFFRRTWAFDEIIVIMDVCRSTNAMQEISKAQLPIVNPHPNANKVKMFIGFATGHNQVARERAFNGEVRGIFTVAMLDALRNANSNKFGKVTGKAIKRYVHNSIDVIAGDMQISPPEINVDEDKDVFFVARQASGVDVEFHINVTYFNHELVIKFGGVDEVYRADIIVSPLSVTLSPGLYKVQIEDFPVSINFEVPTNDSITL